MADDLIHCPSCNFELRLPPELYGTPVECPQCHARFTAPAPAVRPAADRPPPGREYDASRPAYDAPAYPPDAGQAASAVKAPAIILLILTVLSLLLNVYSAAVADSAILQMRQMAADPNMPAQWADILQKIADSTDPALVRVEHLVFAAVNLVTVAGAIQMMRLRTFWLAVVGAILAFNPFNCPCCVTQLPFGIWALVVLFRSDVRMAFR
jgi:hypothetical protein